MGDNRGLSTSPDIARYGSSFDWEDGSLTHTKWVLFSVTTKRMAKTINLSNATLQRPIRTKRAKSAPPTLGKPKSWEGRANRLIRDRHDRQVALDEKRRSAKQPTRRPTQHVKRHGIRRSHIVGSVPNPSQVTELYQCGVIWNEV